jgi:tRNA threonylcarbamoyladenosine biosynthesis protein TsaE
VKPRTAVTHSEQETFALARELAERLKPGTFVLLHGELGAGKTAFVRGLASGLGIDPDSVTSPTFVLIQHYKGAVPLIHADLYRLESAAAVDDLGLEEIGSGGVVAVEWAERMPRVPAGSVSVTIEDTGGDSRKITIDRALEIPIRIGNSALPL